MWYDVVAVVMVVGSIWLGCCLAILTMRLVDKIRSRNQRPQLCGHRPTIQREIDQMGC